MVQLKVKMEAPHVDMLANVENAVWHAFDFLGENYNIVYAGTDCNILLLNTKLFLVQPWSTVAKHLRAN